MLPEVTRRVEAGDLSIQQWVGHVEAEGMAEVLDEGHLERLHGQPALFANANTPEEWARLKGAK